MAVDEAGGVREAVCGESGRRCVIVAPDELDDLPPGVANGAIFAALLDPTGQVFLCERIAHGTGIDVRAALETFAADGRLGSLAGSLTRRPGWSLVFALTPDATPERAEPWWASRRRRRGASRAAAGEAA